MKEEYADTTRVTVDLSAKLYGRLQRLERLTDADSKAGIFRQALQLYDYIANKSLVDGAKFRVIEADGSEEVVMFFLSTEKPEER